MTGWICAKCGRSWAPIVAACEPCNERISQVGGGAASGCLCGSTAGGRWCPIHGGTTCQMTRLGSHGGGLLQLENVTGGGADSTGWQRN